MTEPTVIAIDWSGTRKTNLKSGIWLAEMREGVLTYSAPVRNREDATGYVLDVEGPLIVGFDFSFGFPAWFARERGCTTIDDVWSLAARDGELWLTPTPPFWRDKGMAPPREQRFRRCELRFPRAKSIFQLVGNGQVGAGSVRGMPLLARLRTAGFAIWPFDAAGARTAVEIYPSFVRTLTTSDEKFTTEHERDAVISARVMWDERETIAALSAAIDPTVRLEGDIWAPTPPQSSL